MIIDYHKISVKSPFFKEIEDLYCTAFPIDERRDISEFENVLNTTIHFTVMGIFNDSRFIGFINYWDFETFIYIEHFAIVPKCRNLGVGKESLHKFLLNSQLPVVFEVEPAHDEMSKRRIAFYERMGFKLWNDIYYIQPPYNPNRNSIELKLMTWRFNTVQDVEKAAKIVKQNVYSPRLISLPNSGQK